MPSRKPAPAPRHRSGVDHLRPTETKAWQRLCTLARHPPSMVEQFDADTGRASAYRLNAAGIELDYSKNIVDRRILGELLALARELCLADKTELMFGGAHINTTESRPALHTVLRAAQTGLKLGALDLDDAVVNVRHSSYAFAEAVRDGAHRGCRGEAIQSVVNIGIGGSDLGVRMAHAALEEYCAPHLHFHFVANMDGACLQGILKELKPETTLFVVQSKSFETQETMTNARVAWNWYADLGIGAPERAQHFVAVTANKDLALKFGIAAQRVFPFWDWVGGRYSLWSAAGLVLAIAIGSNRFDELLAGARAMDEHFRHSAAEQNMPVLMALIGVWYHNFLDFRTHALVPYCERLGLLPSYLQQLDMESNGKSVDLNERAVDYATAPVVWGQTGTNAQHAFFQLFHQGTQPVSLDLLAVRRDALSTLPQHRALLANMVAQSFALMRGRRAEDLPSYKQHAGNRPSNILMLDDLSPFCLGALLALYEHKTFVQGAIWGLNSFDQWGVEWGKSLARALCTDEKLTDSSEIPWDPSSRYWIEQLDLRGA